MHLIPKEHFHVLGPVMISMVLLIKELHYAIISQFNSPVITFINDFYKFSKQQELQNNLLWTVFNEKKGNEKWLFP